MCEERNIVLEALRFKQILPDHSIVRESPKLLACLVESRVFEDEPSKSKLSDGRHRFENEPVGLRVSRGHQAS